MAMGRAIQAINPQAAVTWNPANTAGGRYTVKGTFTLNEPSNHNNYYGLTVGGFLIAQDGSFLVKRRAGDAKTDDVVAKTPHAALKKLDASGKSVNVLEVRVLADKVDYAVNGTVVGIVADRRPDGGWRLGRPREPPLERVHRRHRRDAVVRLVVRRPFRACQPRRSRPAHWLKPRCSTSVGSR